MDQQYTNLDSELELWYACAGPLVQIPPANSLVYYFTQGHLEHCCFEGLNMADLGFEVIPPSRILCKVDSVNYLVSPVTNQVCAKFTLTPLHDHPQIEPDDSLDHNPAPPKLFQIYPEDVIRNSKMEPAVHSLPMLDLHHNLREFNILVIGSLVFVGGSWDELLNQMGVVEGDNILMMTDRVGILRGKTRTELLNQMGAVESDVAWDLLLLAYLSALTDALLSAANNETFEVYYYPRFGTPEFVVKAARVEAAMRTQWQVGTRFSMQYEDERTSLAQTCMGTILSVEDVDHENWPSSQWRRLQVIMDPPYLNLNEMRVNPWMLKLETSGESSSHGEVEPDLSVNVTSYQAFLQEAINLNLSD